MSEVEKQKIIDRLFEDHEVRIRFVERAFVEMAAEQKALRQAFVKWDKSNAVTQSLIKAVLAGLGALGVGLFILLVRAFI
ncbi:hypothetical protein [Thioalkalivibrio sp. HK1]|uniref:hypothetical protein n=1 Tax=Thioalkalivibrio sp. HK1 TaxID=1469245 RepID=UPI0004723F2D|nr:hypothetical protein [Thioalkalivibrio sp. HK1]